MVKNSIMKFNVLKFFKLLSLVLDCNAFVNEASGSVLIKDWLVIMSCFSRIRVTSN